MSEEIEGIILGAGFSRRAGTFKMELPFGTKTLLQRVIEGMSETCSRIIVVAGYQVDRTRDMVREYPNVELVLNPLYEKGMFSSVQEGVHHIRGKLFFIVPGDCPGIIPRIYRQLKEAAENSLPDVEIFIPTFKNKNGHPPAFKRSMAAKILKEPQDSTLKNVISKNKYQLIEVDHEGILWDIDTMEDYQKYRHLINDINDYCY
ncbi:MAG: nucleotidyltransferase family protein [Acidobacteria bacterium]|jgi:molybdenum cofactor cytidylyltransferase|nr:nucleotidyltransferase family protein [Acidobacteriota bacterium]